MAERKKWTGKERDAIMYAVALDDSFHKAGPVLEKRIRSYGPTAWRDWRLCETLATRVVNRIVDTLPDKNIQHLQHLLEHASLRFVMPGPVQTPRYCFIREEEMQVLGKYAMRNECASCIRSPEDAKKCELYNALKWCAPPPDRPRDEMSLCPYAEVSYIEDESIV